MKHTELVNLYENDTAEFDRLAIEWAKANEVTTVGRLRLRELFLEAHDDSAPVEFFEADGEPVEMIFDREGILRDGELFNEELRTRAYREPLAFQPTVAEFAGFVGCVFCFIALFAIAILFGGAN